MTQISNCAGCDLPFETASASTWRCSKCVTSNKYPTGWPAAPRCACGCGEPVRWVGAKSASGHWAKFRAGHHMKGNTLRKGIPNAARDTGRRTTQNCENCGLPFTHQERKRRFCCHACYVAANIGTKHHRFNPGKIITVPLGKRKQDCVACLESFTPTIPKQKRCQQCIDDPNRAAPCCECGCGQRVKYSPGNGRRWHSFVLGHRIRVHKMAVKRIYDFRNCNECSQRYKMRKDDNGFCSRSCKINSRAGEVFEVRQGGGQMYRKIRLRGGGAEWEHRIALRAFMKRDYRKDEVVHHVDHNAQNNKPSNLFLFHCQKCHNFFHQHDFPLRYQYEEAHQVDLSPALTDTKSHQEAP